MKRDEWAPVPLPAPPTLPEVLITDARGASISRTGLSWERGPGL